MNHFTDFESDLTEESSRALPKEERARIRKQEEKRVYTIAGIAAGVLLVAVLITVSVLRGGKTSEVATTETTGIREETLQQIAETPIVLAATVAEVQAKETDAVLESTIDAVIEGMTLEEKVAGLFVITPEQLTGAENVTGAGDMTRDALLQYPIGGLYYSERNLKTAEQAKEMLAGVKGYAKYPVFLAINENGSKRSAAAEVFSEEVIESGSAVKDAAAGREAGESVGTYLSLNGFNMNLSPVANLLSGDADDALNGFAYASDATDASAVTGAVVEGLQATGVSACVKYFPFYGSESDRSKAEMYGNEFEPFRAAFESGVDACMVSVGTAPALTGSDEPCAFSSAVVTDLLRLELNYDGIVMTDALNQESVTTNYDAKESVVAALNAGCDMFFLPLHFEASYEGLLDAVADGAVTEERIEESLKRIYRVKYR